MTTANTLTGLEIIPFVQSGVNVQATVNNIATHAPLSVPFIIVGKPITGQVFSWVAPFAITLPANFAGCAIYASTVATSNATFTVNKVSGAVTTAIGTIIILANSTNFTASIQASMTFGTGDVLQLVAPTQDSTLADLSITLAVTRFYDPTLDLNFLTGVLDSRITFTRASSATYFDSTGTLQTAGTNVPRFDYDPVTHLICGLLIEEARTNSIRNSTMVGAVIGTPGTPPTYWSYGSAGGVNGRQVVGTGTTNGIPYVDLRVFGTVTTGGQLYINFVFDSVATASVVGQTWTGSFWFQKIADASQYVVPSYTVTLTQTGGSTIYSVGTAVSGATWQRQSFTVTTSDAGNTGISLGLWSSGASSTIGYTVDITIRVGMPQLELGAIVTSIIPTSGATATRAIDICSMPTGSWYNAAVSSLAVEARINYAAANNFPGIVQIDDGGISNRFEFYIHSLGIYFGDNYLSNLNDAVISLGNVQSSNIFKISATIQLNNVAACLNGYVATGVAAHFPGILLNRLLIGSLNPPSNVLNGYIRRIRYWPRALSTIELQSVTT